MKCSTLLLWCISQCSSGLKKATKVPDTCNQVSYLLPICTLPRNNKTNKKNYQKKMETALLLMKEAKDWFLKNEPISKNLKSNTPACFVPYTPHTPALWSLWP